MMEIEALETRRTPVKLCVCEQYHEMIHGVAVCRLSQNSRLQDAGLQDAGLQDCRLIHSICAVTS